MITLPANDLSPNLLEFITQQQELIARQQEQIAQQQELIVQQQEQIVQLQEREVQQQIRIEASETEITRLKKLNPKPNIKPNTKPPDDDDPGSLPPDSDNNGKPEASEDGDSLSRKSEVEKPDETTRRKRSQPPDPPVSEEHSITPEAIPEGSVRHGRESFTVQELELLWDAGISISAGQLSNLLTKGHDGFHAEKDELLATGIRCSHYLQTDDTGARHQGQNGYCTVIVNDLFTWFGTTGSKSRENFLTLLHRPWHTYILNSHALDYLQRQDFTRKWQRVLESYPETHFPNRKAWEGFMDDIGLEEHPKLRQTISAAMLYGSLVHHGFDRHMVTFSDGARQFDVFDHAQCWLHGSRPLDKVIPVNEQQANAQYWCLNWFWDIYRDLKAFKAAPSEEMANKIRQGFDSLVHTQTNCSELQAALGGLEVVKEELLRVLNDPTLPLHNNLSESQIREHVKRRKISGGTRSEAGRQCRDTRFIQKASLKKTCRQHGLSFWDYLTDRLNGTGSFPRLADVIEYVSYWLPCGQCRFF